MKMVTKIWLIVAVCCLVFGGLMAAAAAAAFDFNFTVFDTDSGEMRDFSPGETFSSLDIRTAAADVQILPATDGQCRITYAERKNLTYQITVKNGTLFITRIDHRKWYEHITFSWGIRSIDDTVRVYLPEKAYTDLTLISVSGELYISEGFTFDTAQVNSISGDIHCKSESKEKLSVKTTSGEITVENTQGASLEISSTSGDVELVNVKASGGVINTVSGDVSLERTVLSGALSIGTVSGDVGFDYSDAQSLQIKTVSGDVDGTLLSKKNFLTHTVSGEVRLSGSDPQAAPCSVTTTSGDIELIVRP